VNTWANHQLKLLDEKIANGRANDKTLWQEFERDFKNAYTFVATKENALAELEGLTMGRNEVDKHIATFNCLVEEAGFNKTDKGVIKMFKQGLNVELKIACIKRKPKPTTMDEWQDVAREEQSKFLKI
jgi:hypothetical protein